MAKKFLYLTGYQWVWVLYIAVAIFTWQLKYFRHIDNNFLIFRTSYYHAIAQLNMYINYPEYYDLYCYGPVFPAIIAPIALLPESAGFFIWEVGNAVALLYAIHLLPLSTRIKTAILLLCAIEFANSVFYMQINPIITAIIILSFVLVLKQKETWATMLIVLGTMVKLYPIIGLAFFMFSRHKLKFTIWTAVWSIVFLLLPLVITSSSFVIKSYHDWFSLLSIKNAQNVALTTTQDWCLMGVVRRLLQDATIPNWPFLLAGAIIFAIPLLRFNQYKSLKFRLQVLASALIMVVIFSTGSEHPTYIIAVSGAVLYIMLQDKPFTAYNVVLLVLLLVVTGLGPSDAFPRFMRVWMGEYSVKAWPVIVVWFQLAYQLIRKDFVAESSQVDKNYHLAANDAALVM
jgi:hypothetical protein